MSSRDRMATLLRRLEENPQTFFPPGCEEALPCAVDVLKTALKHREVEDGVENKEEVEVITIDDDASASPMVKVSYGAKLPALPTPAQQEEEEKYPRIFVFSSAEPGNILELVGGKVLPSSLDIKCTVEVRPY